MLAVKNHLINTLNNVEWAIYPFNYFYSKDVFPSEFYNKMIENLPNESELQSMQEYRNVSFNLYPNRSMYMLDKSPFWKELHDTISIKDIIMNIPSFRDLIVNKLGDLSKYNLKEELYLTRDKTGYSLLPHTDKGIKLFTFVFYLAKDVYHPDVGTSVLTSNNMLETETGNLPHVTFDEFTELYRAKYLPNTMFGFFRDNKSFHSVMPITEPNITRWCLMFHLKYEYK